ncbi:MAG: zinc ABC transporter substrate-binding protein [Clostridia bacterium]|nr:zinc ABC transporter substrate-binding protein [Clostridia bacterium]
MKRFLSFMLIILLLLSGCATPKQQNEKPLILCTLFASYDWARNILGDQADRFDLRLLGNGADLHSFEPSALDFATLQQADLLICNGGSSEDWLPKEPKRLLNLAEHSTLLALPHDHTEEEHEHTIDEHTWLSLNNAQKGVDAICDALCTLAPDLQEELQANAAAYKGQLAALDQEYQKACGAAENCVLIFADRYPFRYLAADYDLTCYAAFDGCSAETEASAATITMLADAVDTHRVPALLILEQSKPDLAQTIIESSDAEGIQILTLNSMQSTEQMTASYLDIMKKNLETLKKVIH